MFIHQGRTFLINYEGLLATAGNEEMFSLDGKKKLLYGVADYLEAKKTQLIAIFKLKIKLFKKLF